MLRADERRKTLEPDVARQKKVRVMFKYAGGEDTICLTYFQTLPRSALPPPHCAAFKYALRTLILIVVLLGTKL